MKTVLTQRRDERNEMQKQKAYGLNKKTVFRFQDSRCVVASLREQLFLVDHEEKTGRSVETGEKEDFG